MANETKNYEYCNDTINLKRSIEGTFMVLAEHLSNIKAQSLYLPAWSSWEEYVNELKMSTNMVNKLIQMHEMLVLEYSIPTKQVIAAGGWTVIADLLPIIKTKAQAVEWLEKAKTLTRDDLRKEMKEAKSGVQMSSCKHKNTYTIVVCRDCGLKIEDHKDHA